MIRSQTNRVLLPVLWDCADGEPCEAVYGLSTCENLPEELVQCKRISSLALPYCQNLPPHGHQSSSIRLIPGDILRELVGPEL